MPLSHFKILFFILVIIPAAAMAGQHSVKVVTKADQRCVMSNGLPNHDTGKFPNDGNPHKIKEQKINLCVPLNPRKKSRPSRHGGSVGIALNGVQIRPGTADFYDASSRRGMSRDRSSGWNFEGLGARDKLGMDHNNAHVDNTGLYHYHGVATALVSSVKDSLVAYAADGFEIHYVGDDAQSSYQLKKGKRPTEPWGKYDGTFNQDWEYVEGSGTLDECNGGLLNGRYVYYATQAYPFFPRCLWGEISQDFRHGQGPREGGSRGGERRHPPRGEGHHHRPPPPRY